ncbi:S-formylglutathione hydrolase [Vibrio sp. MACH09]|uniref:S-formylglutathione hydrolase n=1 Tax=Vibrio sp. MACH09 TaxID=3025122 RepID=UPI0027911360|nr:S-formylglutathione hydrolase [Vibrio sp. MACH09]GLO62478.1 S-formylglutathione hydrolase [Vibrio sp. MACH09]
MSIENISQAKVAGGWHKQYTFHSKSLNGTTRFAIFLPENASQETPVPVMYWLSGLTCSDENFMQKAGAFKSAAEHGIAIVAADTSPRGDDVPDDAEGAYDFGLGAGFYVNATESPWNKHYHMYDFIVNELPDVIEANFPVSDQRAISGHSMGGHGALMIALRNPQRYSSVSAFSPIVNPIAVPWGQKAFSHYLGNNRQEWEKYDSCKLMASFQDTAVPALVDQGDKDDFLQNQLKTELLAAVVKKTAYPMTIRMQPGYDHSYFFISTFIADHIQFHAQHWKK